jgi:hypothetical protein
MNTSKLCPNAQELYDAAEATLKQFEIPEDTLRTALAASLHCLSDKWEREIGIFNNKPKTEFIRGITNCTTSLTEIADDLEGKS